LEELALPSVGASFKKCRRCTPILPKAQAHFPNFQKNIFLFLFLFQKNWDSPTGLGVDLRPAGDRWSPAGRMSMPGPIGLFPFLLKFFSSCLLLFAQVVNSFSLAAAHAHPAQTSP
jgi:hypothetical protein